MLILVNIVIRISRDNRAALVRNVLPGRRRKTTETFSLDAGLKIKAKCLFNLQIKVSVCG